MRGESHKEITMDAKAIVVDNNKERCFEILTWKPRKCVADFPVLRGLQRMLQCHMIQSLLPQERTNCLRVFRIDASQRTAPVPTGRLNNQSNACQRFMTMLRFLVSL